MPGSLLTDGRADLAIAMGASGILGDQAATLAGLAAAVRPGGSIVFGDGVWSAEPPDEGLASFGMTRGELPSGPAALLAIGRGLGLVPLDVETVSQAEWD